MRFCFSLFGYKRLISLVYLKLDGIGVKIKVFWRKWTVRTEILRSWKKGEGLSPGIKWPIWTFWSFTLILRAVNYWTSNCQNWMKLWQFNIWGSHRGAHWVWSLVICRLGDLTGSSRNLQKLKFWKPYCWNKITFYICQINIYRYDLTSCYGFHNFNFI